MQGLIVLLLREIYFRGSDSANISWFPWGKPGPRQRYAWKRAGARRYSQDACGLFLRTGRAVGRFRQYCFRQRRAGAAPIGEQSASAHRPGAAGSPGTRPPDAGGAKPAATCLVRRSLRALGGAAAEATAGNGRQAYNELMLNTEMT